MANPADSGIVDALDDVVAGRVPPAERLLPAVYDEMRSMAQNLFRRQSAGHTLEPTALVHEVFLRLVPREDLDGGRQFESRAHFLAVAAKAMRQILANHARDKGAAKRGGNCRRVTLDGIAMPTKASDLDLHQLDRVLDELRELDAEQYRIVELRVLAGMATEEIALVLSTTQRTVQRKWRGARAWLQARLADGNVA